MGAIASLGSADEVNVSVIECMHGMHDPLKWQAKVL